VAKLLSRMFKATLLGFHFLTSLLLSGYKGETTVVHNLPELITTTEETEIEMIILKDNFEGPAKLVIDWSKTNVHITEGFSSGASFSYNNKKSLFIWYSIESDNIITLTYKIKGKLNDAHQKVTGYFYYVKNGETIKVPVMPTVKIPS
jgi:hypothetical protein